MPLEMLLMEVRAQLKLFLVVWSGICVSSSLAALPERNCSTSIALRASKVGDVQCTYTDSVENTAGDLTDNSQTTQSFILFPSLHV